jgi:hypothetical protein
MSLWSQQPPNLSIERTLGATVHRLASPQPNFTHSHSVGRSVQGNQSHKGIRARSCVATRKRTSRPSWSGTLRW